MLLLVNTRTWYPCGPNSFISYVVALSVAEMDVSNDDDEDGDSLTGGQCQTDLDTHANMSVCGHNGLTIADAGETVEVNAYSPTLPSLTVIEVDTVV